MIQNWADIKMSLHGQTRCQQRGLPSYILVPLLEHADRSERSYNGCEVIWLSRSEANRLRATGIVSAALLDRLVNCKLVLGTSGTLVTAFHSDPRRSRRARH
jgi:hypothetical protein